MILQDIALWNFCTSYIIYIFSRNYLKAVLLIYSTPKRVPSHKDFDIPRLHKNFCISNLVRSKEYM